MVSWLKSCGTASTPAMANTVHSPMATRFINDRSSIPVFADEDIKGPEDLDRLAGCVSGVNIKLVKCGGITRALDIIRGARAMKLQIMIGCMTESSLGITAGAHITPLVDYADLDGNLLLRDDPYRGVLVRQGKLLLPEEPGLGVVARSS